MQLPIRTDTAPPNHRFSARWCGHAAALLFLVSLTGGALADESVSLHNLPDEYFTLQLIALPDREALERFVADRAVSGLMASPVLAGDEVRYALFMGSYATREAAEEAARDLPPELADLRPWIRPIRSLKQAVPRASDALNSTTPESR